MRLSGSLRWLLLLAMIFAELQQSTVMARRKHRIRHNVQRRLKRQQSSQVYAYSAAQDSGPWGIWGTQSPCSRSCGGGVAFQVRRCQDERPDGSSSCTGPNKQYISCNIEPCPGGSGDLREEQCTEFDRLPFEGRYYKWIPYLKAPNQCELNCQPQGERFYYRHKRRVIDGTSCGPEGLDVCVDGQCMQVGCDRMLGSTVKEDRCRVCGGDGSDCYTAHGVFDAENLQSGYNDILLIPKGATNIIIEEIKATNNYLAIRNSTGHYYLNGNWRIDYPTTMEFAGGKVHYERRPLGFFSPETVRALGPTSEALYVVLLYQERNAGIRYEYSVPRTVADAGSSEYSWVTSAWSPCSEQCGGGGALLVM
ncbi:papilin-like [Pollicipes pollicipes]|uniref:papilin-like n=1 Tax=Pollicipes pollicipes TaxID=41117 RepID=UPI00188507D4|nr:papilin-like [Pollicipes pollicipes]